jgi:pimeloyl-ACP methyl ester carboxylesterase
MQIKVGDLTFDAESTGKPGNPLVLLLHGFPQTSHTWRHQLLPLAAAGYYAVAPNQRGYSAGARPPASESYATNLLLEDATGMIESLGYDAAHIVGHDWGGQLSWLLAGFHSEWVDSLTVLSRPHPQAFHHALKQDTRQADRSRHHRAFQDPASATLLLEDNARRLRRIFSDQGVSLADQDAYLAVLGDPEALNAAINWYRAPALSGQGQALAARNTPGIALPTLYIWGDADATVGAVAAEATGNYVTGPYRFEVLPGIGHFITDQAGDTVSQLLLAHLHLL